MAYRLEDERKDLSDAEVGKGARIVRFDKEEFPAYALMPGDPERVHIMAGQWNTAEEHSLERGHRAAIGRYKNVDIAAYSSGIGGPSSEVVITDLAALGVQTIIRVGTTGAIQPGIECGDLIINEASVRLDGTTHFYVREEYPAVASYEVTMALVEAAERLGYGYHVGVGATSGSFYAGQARVGFGGYKKSGTDQFLADMQLANVLNFEMEAATLLTLSRLFGLRAGAVCSVVANRVTGEWEDRGGIERSCLVGAEAIRLLTEWDRKKKQSGKNYISPGMIQYDIEDGDGPI